MSDIASSDRTCWWCVYLGIGALGAQSVQFQNDYRHHTVEAARPGLIVPVHKTKDLLDRKSAESGIPRFVSRGPFETITPFS